jgi:hypothetical protein
MAACMVACRPLRPVATRGPGGPFSSMSSSSRATGISLARTAASSMASGMPSRRRHSSATSWALPSFSSKAGSTATTRSRNSDTDSTCARSAGGDPAPGTASGRTMTACSPGARSACLLVTSTCRPGAARSSRCTSLEQASARCSQLSSTSSRRRCARCAARSPGTSSVCAMACSRDSGSAWPASSTNEMPSVKARRISCAARMATRVLPTPAMPVMVTRRLRWSIRRTSATSWRRPTKLVSAVGGVARHGMVQSLVSGWFQETTLYGSSP